MASTIEDVARAASVSIATVSRALNGRARVSPVTAERVRRIAEELGYRPSRSAAVLRGSSTRRLGLIVPDLTNPFFVNLVTGAQSRVRELGYSLLVSDTDDDPWLELELLETLGARADGLVLATPRMAEVDLETLDLPVPLVLLHRTSAVHPYIISDVARGVQEAVDNLVALGHNSIGYVDGPSDSWSAGLRRRCIAELEVPAAVRVVTLCQVAARFEGGIAAGDVVAASDVSAVLAFNDIVAFGLQHRLHERGLRIPRDFSIVGFDGIAAAAMVSPALTTVSQPIADSGRIAVSHLHRLLNGQEVPSETLLDPRLVVRESTAPPLTVTVPAEATER